MGLLRTELSQSPEDRLGLDFGPSTEDPREIDMDLERGEWEANHFMRLLRSASFWGIRELVAALQDADVIGQILIHPALASRIDKVRVTRLLESRRKEIHNEEYAEMIQKEVDDAMEEMEEVALQVSKHREGEEDQYDAFEIKELMRCDPRKY